MQEIRKEETALQPAYRNAIGRFYDLTGRLGRDNPFILYSSSAMSLYAELEGQKLEKTPSDIDILTTEDGLRKLVTIFQEVIETQQLIPDFPETNRFKINKLDIYYNGRKSEISAATGYHEIELPEADISFEERNKTFLPGIEVDPLNLPINLTAEIEVDGEMMQLDVWTGIGGIKVSKEGATEESLTDITLEKDVNLVTLSNYQDFDGNTNSRKVPVFSLDALKRLYLLVAKIEKGRKDAALGLAKGGREEKVAEIATKLEPIVSSAHISPDEKIEEQEKI